MIRWLEKMTGRAVVATRLLGMLLLLMLGGVSVVWGEEAEPETVVEERTAFQLRRADEETAMENPFAIVGHKLNYLLPLAYNTRPNSAPYAADSYELDNLEVKFQFSFKMPIVRNLVARHGHLYFAYTNLSFWQAYNWDVSSPFRETNHEPEIFFAADNDWSLFGVRNSRNAIGISHQSNGYSGPQSRSWNRVYALLGFTRGNFLLSLKPWYRIPEREKRSATDAGGDDNPDIDRYLGHGELSAFYKHDNQTFGLMLRNNLRRYNNKGAVQLDWSFPLTRRVKGYVQFFDGYGESLIDYNASVTRLGVGVLLTDWL